MASQFKTIFKLLNARLSKSIAIWIFLSLIIVEALILVPSVYRRKQEFISNLSNVSSSKIAWIVETYPYNSEFELLQQLKSLSRLYPIIVGGAIYRNDGELVGEFGEVPLLGFSDALAGKSLYFTSEEGDRYEIASNNNPIKEQYLTIIRHDASQLDRDIKAYILRIAGLVFIIASVVTSVTFFLLGKTIIIPVLKLRQDLIKAGNAIIYNQAIPQFESTSSHQNNELGDVILAFQTMFHQIYQANTERNEAEAALRLEKEKSEQLLLNILPLAIAEKLKEEQGCIADRFEEATILFADITDFTGLSSQVSPTSLVNFLNEIFSLFDRLVDKYQLEKIKTIGDAYMVVGGIPTPRWDHADAIAEIALEMQAAIQQFRRKDHQLMNIRIGINTGPVVAGVIGIKKFSYDLWGDAVNIASRMESHGIPGQIQVSQSTYHHLKDKYDLEERGTILIKGKGEMTTYWLKGKLVTS